MKLTQKSLIDGTLEFQLLDNKIKLQHNKLGRLQTNSFEYSYLDDDFDAYKVVPYKQLVLSLVLLLISVSFLVQAFVGEQFLFVAASMFFILSTFFFYRFIRYTTKLTVVKWRNAGGAAFSLRSDDPDVEQFEKFVNRLKEKILASHGTRNLTASEKLHVYERHIDFLFNEGVLTEAEAATVFTRIKEQLIKKTPNIYSISKNDG